MRETLRDINLKITELADYLKLSRPTMYKYIDAYESGNYKSIDKGVLSLFRYIDKNKKVIGKPNVVQYILSNISVVSPPGTTKESELVTKFASMVKNGGTEDSKVKLISNLINGKNLDKLIPYLNDVEPILGKSEMTEEEEAKIKPIEEIYKIKGNTMPNIGRKKEKQ